MPPPLPEDDSEIEEFEIPMRERDESVKSEDQEPPKAKRGPIGVKDMPGARELEEDNEDEEEEEEGDDDEDVYVIEAIRKHMLDEDGTIKFQVKWEGWDKKSDLTWEPEETLREDAEEVLDAYLESIGGREAVFEQSEKAAKTKKRGRQSSGAAGAAAKRSRKNGAHPADAPPPASAKKFSPPAGSWEDLIESVEASQDEGSGKIMVYLTWKNGNKTRHETSVVNKKLPQKMLQYYERHIRIVPGEVKVEDD